jgi:hypothetical protein
LRDPLGFSVEGQIHCRALEAGAIMSFAFFAVGGALALLVGMLVMLALGRTLGRRAGSREVKGEEGMGAIDAALVGLLSLVFAFTFSSAAERFDTRRDLIVEETTAIETAYVRIDLLPPETQPMLRADFQRYVDSRLAAYEHFPNVKAAFRELDRSKELEMQIWRDALVALRNPSVSPDAEKLVVPALNTMMEIGTTQVMNARKHPPPEIFAMLAVLSLVGASVIGYATASLSRWWLHAIAFAVLFAATFYVILQLEYPRLGFIGFSDFDRELRALRQTMQS